MLISINSLEQKHGETYNCKLRVPIRHKRQDDKHNRRPHIYRYSQHVTHQRIVPNALQDRRQESAEPVEQNVLTELDDGAEGELRVAQGEPHLLPGEVLVTHVVSALLVAHAHHPLFLVGEKVGVGGVVGQTEPDEDGADDAEEAFDDVYPSSLVSIV